MAQNDTADGHTAPQSSAQLLDAAPKMVPLLLAGALRAPRKRAPYTGARLPQRRLELRDVAVESAALRRYAEVCGFPVESFPVERTALPPTYPHLLGFGLQLRLMSAPDFPFPLPGLVHTGIELHQEARLETGGRLDLTAWAEELQPHRRGSQFAMVTEARRDGEVVWRSSSRYLCRHRPSENAPAESQQPTAERAAPLPVRGEWQLPRDLGRRYGAASGDRNPIHLSAPTAKLFGFPRAIAHGMWSFARCLAASEVQQAYARGERGERLDAEAEFKAPVLLPTTVRFGEGEPDEPDRPGASAPPVGPTQRAASTPPHTTAIELRGLPRGTGADAQPGRVHLSGSVSSGRPAPATRGPSS